MYPYKKCILEFIFSPRTSSTKKGWNQYQTESTQRDYSVLFKFVITNKLPSDNIFADEGEFFFFFIIKFMLFVLCTMEGCKLMVAIASARPVHVRTSPEKMMDFGSCFTGNAVIKNIEVLGNDYVHVHQCFTHV